MFSTGRALVMDLGIPPLGIENLTESSRLKSGCFSGVTTCLTVLV